MNKEKMNELLDKVPQFPMRAPYENKNLNGASLQAMAERHAKNEKYFKWLEPILYNLSLLLSVVISLICGVMIAFVGLVHEIAHAYQTQTIIVVLAIVMIPSVASISYLRRKSSRIRMDSKSIEEAFVIFERSVQNLESGGFKFHLTVFRDAMDVASDCVSDAAYRVLDAKEQVKKHRLDLDITDDALQREIAWIAECESRFELLWQAAQEFDLIDPKKTTKEHFFNSAQNVLSACK